MSDIAIRRTPTKGRPSYFDVEYSDDVNERFIPPRKAPFVLSSQHRVSGDIPFDYVGLLDAKFTRRQKAPIGFVTQAEVRLEVKNKRFTYPKFYTWLGFLVFILIGGGIIATAVKPSAIAEIGVPLGFTLWAILAFLLRSADRRHVNA